MVIEITDKLVKESIASIVLNNLPEWFGVKEYTDDYIEKSRNLPFFSIMIDDKPIGFISLKETSKHALEIYCMGVLKKYHRLGYGKLLVEEAEKYGKKNNYKFLHVKTVEHGKYEIYDLTNAFYKKLGFDELEVLASLWDEHNPCQLLIKSI